MIKVDAKIMHSLRHLIWKEVEKQGWRFVLYFVVIAFAGAVTIAPPKFYGYFSETVGGMQTLNHASAVDFLYNLFLFGAILALASFFANFMKAVAEEWISLRIEGSLRLRFMSFMHRMPLEGFDESQRGDWLTRMSGDIRAVEQFIALRLPTQISDAVVTLGIAAVFIAQNALIAVVLILSSVLLALINLVIQNRLTPILDHLRDLHGEVFQGLLENFEGLRSIRSYRAESFVLKFFNQRVQAIIEKGLGLIRIVGFMIGSNSFVVNMLTTGTLCLVTFKLRNNEILLSDVFLYPFYIGMFYTSVFALVRGAFDWNDFIVHAKRLDEVFQSSRPEDDYVEAKPYTGSFDSLEIRNAVIGYKGFAKLTVPFDFSIKKGETVVIRGHSGCGKSTFLECLAGLRALEKESARLYEGKRLCEELCQAECLPVDLGVYVEQRPYLLEGSLRNNLLLGKDSISDSQLWSSLESVRLDAFFKERDGLDFIIKDNGRNLSEGQKQRVGIARSLVHLRPLILLDEPFASLDQDSVASLCTTLNALRAEHGLVIVTHVIPESLQFDRIVDFDSFSSPNAAKESEDGEAYPEHNSMRQLADDPCRTLVDCMV